jgi:peptide/nickel transport system substrate-binding protein
MRRPRRAGRAAFAALLCATVLFVAATAALAGESASPFPGGAVTLKAGWVTEPDNLNPFIGYTSSDTEIWHLNYDYLVGYEPRDFAPRPELATEIPTKLNGGISDDGKTVTFKLREDVKWQDGQSLTAKDVAFTYNFILDNQVAYWLVAVAGVKKVVAVDDYTVRFDLSDPKPDLMRTSVPILPEHIWGKMSPKAATTSFENKPPIIGSGPFQTTEFKKGKYIKMVRNDAYWRGPAKVDELIFAYYTNQDTMSDDLKIGNLDLVRDVTATKLKQLESNSDVKAIHYPTGSFDFMGINGYENAASKGNPVLRDVAFRNALAWAVDREKVAALSNFGFARPATSVISDTSFGDIDYHWEPPADQVYTYDPEKAKQMLDAAGYKDTDGDGVREYKGKPIELRLWSTDSWTPTQTTGKLVAGWLEDVGIETQYQVMNQGALIDSLYSFDKAGNWTPDYDLYILAWISYLDPSQNLLSWTTEQMAGGWNDCGWSNPEFDTVAKESAVTIDPETGAGDSIARRDLIWKAQELFYGENPYVVFTYPEELQGYNVAKWEGWVPMQGKAVAFRLGNNIDSYWAVHPKAATTTTTSSGSGSTTWIIIAIAAALVAFVAVVLLRRRGRRVEEG